MARIAHDQDTLRARAIDEARVLMKEGGPDAVKAREIAKALGVSVGTVYNLFGHLGELILRLNGQVYDELYGAVTTGLAEAVEAGEDVTGQMVALSGAYLHFVAENSGLWGGVLAYNRRSREAPPVWYRKKELALLGVIAETIKAFPGAKDEDRRDIATRALWAAVHGIVTISVARGGLIAPEDEVQAQMELVVRSVAARLAA